ncbi:hypothetical protein KP509_03G078500 [Ceratopteris richardii]|uniref:Uncharacterized protein n=1 Tax=Ceratopteris richardii TaxID=49495 RepID=A0A8T2V5D1_CERRI|nr:hypothetical protein KP509_03G078500 [Ceratopteris richardii]
MFRKNQHFLVPSEDASRDTLGSIVIPGTQLFSRPIPVP